MEAPTNRERKKPDSSRPGPQDARGRRDEFRVELQVWVEWDSLAGRSRVVGVGAEPMRVVEAAPTGLKTGHYLLNEC
jgi:hypothetical protein